MVIKVYSRNNCVNCTLLKLFIKGNGGEVDECNIDADPVAKQEFDSFGVMGVPVTLIDGKPLVGFNPLVQQNVLRVLKQ